MNLNQLKYAQAVAETSSFSRASEKSFVTQPSLSNAIAQLEEELGGRLFFRTTHNVSVTPFGERMLPLVTAVLDAQQTLEKTAKSLTAPAKKLVRIGFCPLVNLQLLASVLEPFKLANRDVEIVMKECLVDDLRERLAAGKVDVPLCPKRL
jgi:DNA-binding transcriptional LysR family regulator